MTHPDKTDRLIDPEPAASQGADARAGEQSAAAEEQRTTPATSSSRTRHKKLTPEVLAFWVKEPRRASKYVEAFKRSSIEGMLNYYKANYPREPYKDDQDFPKVKCPVLMIHGLEDQYLLPGALNDTWKWVEKDLTLVTVPEGGPLRPPRRDGDGQQGAACAGCGRIEFSRPAASRAASRSAEPRRTKLDARERFLKLRVVETSEKQAEPEAQRGRRRARRDRAEWRKGCHNVDFGAALAALRAPPCISSVNSN